MEYTFSRSYRQVNLYKQEASLFDFWNTLFSLFLIDVFSLILFPSFSFLWLVVGVFLNAIGPICLFILYGILVFVLLTASFPEFHWCKPFALTKLFVLIHSFCYINIVPIIPKSSFFSKPVFPLMPNFAIIMLQKEFI